MSRAHRHQFLGGRRVHGDGGVEVGLGRAHRHRHRDELDHFGRLVGEDMRADDAVVRAVDDQLHDRAVRRARHRRLQRPEVGLVDVDAWEPLQGFPLRQSNRAQFGRAEHRARDRVVADRRRALAEQPVGERVPLANGDRGEVDPVGGVADGVDRRHVAGQILVDLDRAMRGAELDPRGLEAEPLGVGQAAGRDQHLIGFDHGAVGQRTLSEPSRLFSIRVGNEPKRKATPARAIASRMPLRMSSSKPRRRLGARMTWVTSEPSRWNSDANSTAI